MRTAKPLGGDIR